MRRFMIHTSIEVRIDFVLNALNRPKSIEIFTAILAFQFFLDWKNLFVAKQFERQRAVNRICVVPCEAWNSLHPMFRYLTEIVRLGYRIVEPFCFPTCYSFNVCAKLCEESTSLYILANVARNHDTSSKNSIAIMRVRERASGTWWAARAWLFTWYYLSHR